MTRDFSRDLTIMVAGSGNVTLANLEDSLGDWIFPDPETEREVHVIIPVLAGMGGGVRNLIKLGTSWGFTFTVIQAKDAPMTRELAALPEEAFVRVDHERDALEHGLTMLTERHKAGDETAFMLAYNPSSTYEQGSSVLSDYEIIGDAKNYQWLQTLNLCESLVDSFEGFETTDEYLKRERLQKEFAEKKAAEEAAKPAPVKKAPAPRKRAQKKVEPQESKPLATEPEKPLQEPSEPTREDVVASGLNDPAVPLYDQENVTDADEINRIVFLNKEAADADARNELSASVTVITGVPEVNPEDINVSIDYVRENLNMDKKTIQVSKIDLAQLSTDIKELTTAFGNIMDTFTRILKDG